MTGTPLGPVNPSEASETPVTELYDLRVTVDRIEGRSVCGMAVGDYFELVDSAHLRIPEGRHFCVYALQAVLPLLPAKQRALPSGDWLERDTLVCCPDPEERLIMRIDRIGTCRLNTEDVT
ncbi:TIGR04076 family protein [Actinoallomurus acanthiterrae]